MPGRRTHQVVGTLAGTATGAYRSRNQKPEHRLPEILGGAFGGYVGSTFADYLEPAVSSWHRGPAHSGGTGAMVLASIDMFAKWEAFCRSQADRCAAIPTVRVATPHGTVFVASLGSPVDQLFRALAELFWRFLAGIPAGFGASYVSHLALDAGTPRSIPLLPGL